MTERAHLVVIEEVTTLAATVDIELWLRGGWAVDFTLGRITRSHEDIDWFVMASDLKRLTALLEEQGWMDIRSAPADQQRDLLRDSVDLGIAALELDVDDCPVVGGGPWRGERYPQEMLSDARPCTLGQVRATVISPGAQIEIKRMMPEWVPGMRRRQKDHDDIKKLETFLAGQGRSMS